tara:strand:- start:31 stop:1074 length:1044 start_codon:yes stop_codon:yes gene_type:complete
MGKFKIGLTRDVLGDSGKLPVDDIGLSTLDGREDIQWEYLEEDNKVLTAEQVDEYDALLVFGSRVEKSTLEGNNPPALIVRFGVGYDTVDVDACTQKGIALAITPEGVRRPMASTYVAFILALGHKMMWKDQITRNGRWDLKNEQIGVGLKGRVLGLVGMGNIGSEVFNLIRPFEMEHIAYDPYMNHDQAVQLGVNLVELDTVMGEADFVCICCMLNDETHHLIDSNKLALMKNSAFLINAARGPIVDQSALTEVLREKRIQGAALDVFDPEPTDPNDPILSLDNVILTPHTMGMTDQSYSGMGKSAFSKILDVASGKVPSNVVNPIVLSDSRFKQKLENYRASISN